MSFLISKIQCTEAENATTINNNCAKDHEERLEISSAGVTSQVHLKPAHSTETLDKEVVLRRIRQRKRVNKLRAALQGFVGYPVSSSSDHKVPVRWVDDAFAAP